MRPRSIRPTWKLLWLWQSLLSFPLILAGAAPACAQQSAQSNSAESRMITGRVMSESGQPLAGAIVVAAGLAGSMTQRTSTDNEGYFKLQGLDSGWYRMAANLPGYVSQTFQPDPNNPPPSYRPGESVAITLVKGGVISGIVLNADGGPVVNVTIRAFRIRDAEGNKVRAATNLPTRMTDDRGYYRLYGLQPGTYVVAAGGANPFFGGVNPFANDALTYAPSSTRDTAVEITVRSEQEATADIRYRGEPGHTISGKVTGNLPAPPFNAGVQLIDVESRMPFTTSPASGEERAFQINGVSDGEYEISALGGGVTAELFSSAPRRISVRGADVTGIELALAPLGSIGGRVVLEADQKLNCGRRRENAIRETLVALRRGQPEEKAGAQKTKEEPTGVSVFPAALDSVPNESGEINFRNLTPATYRLEVRAPAAGWYVRAITTGPRATTRPPGVNIPKNGIDLKIGEKVTDLAVTVTEGGAGFRGRLTTGEGQSLPAGLRLYLVPVEKDQSDNVLRFFEGVIAQDGSFAIGNLAPGRYWMMAQLPEPLDAGAVKSIRSDSAFRAKVLRDAETQKKEIGFKPCERIADYEVPFSSQTSPE